MGFFGIVRAWLVASGYPQTRMKGHIHHLAAQRMIVGGEGQETGGFWPITQDPEENFGMFVSSWGELWEDLEYP